MQSVSKPSPSASSCHHRGHYFGICHLYFSPGHATSSMTGPWVHPHSLFFGWDSALGSSIVGRRRSRSGNREAVQQSWTAGNHSPLGYRGDRWHYPHWEVPRKKLGPRLACLAGTRGTKQSGYSLLLCAIIGQVLWEGGWQDPWEMATGSLPCHWGWGAWGWTMDLNKNAKDSIWSLFFSILCSLLGLGRVLWDLKHRHLERPSLRETYRKLGIKANI